MVNEPVSRQLDGVLVLNKPKGISSAACVGLVKRRLKQRKIGHAGTLDPLATGVLLVLLGQATKIAGLLLKHGGKIYSGVIRFGLHTDTWDIEGKILDQTDSLPAELNEAALREALESMRGSSEQEVPPFSAAKYEGRPLYRLARKGLATPVKRKIIEISRAELEWFMPPLARFRVACGSGTYIRSLAHSLGIRFGCGVTLMELTREYSHPFGLDKSVTLDELDGLNADPALLDRKVYGLRESLPQVPAFVLEAEAERLVRNGRGLPLELLPAVPAEQALFLDEKGAPLALGRKTLRNGQALWSIGRGLWNN